MFKGHRLFSLQRVWEMKPTASSLDQSLSCLPFLDADELERLKSELPAYLARVCDLDPAFNPLEWWKQNAPVLPSLSSAAKKILLVQPSSAAAERVFFLIESVIWRSTGQFFTGLCGSVSYASIQQAIIY